MATRALNHYEKYRLTQHAVFVGVLEMRALVNAKYWHDFNGTAVSVGLTDQELAQLKAYSNVIHEKGYLPENVNFARTWLSIYAGAVVIPETTPGTEDWVFENPDHLTELTKWFVTSDQISAGIDDTFKIRSFT